MKIDLLPQEHRPQAAVSIPRLGFAIGYGVLILAATLFLLGDVASLATVEGNLVNTKRELDLYGQQYQNVKYIEKLETDLQKKRNEINMVKSPFIQVEAFLGAVSGPLPSNVWLKKIEINENGNVVLNGKTDRIGSVAVYMMDLEATKMVTNTRLQEVSQEETEGMADLYNFNLLFDIAKAGVKKDGQH